MLCRVTCVWRFLFILFVGIAVRVVFIWEIRRVFKCLDWMEWYLFVNMAWKQGLQEVSIILCVRIFLVVTCRTMLYKRSRCRMRFMVTKVSWQCRLELWDIVWFSRFSSCIVFFMGVVGRVCRGRVRFVFGLQISSIRLGCIVQGVVYLFQILGRVSIGYFFLVVQIWF